MKKTHAVWILWAGCLAVGILAGFGLARSANAAAEPEVKGKNGAPVYVAPLKAAPKLAPAHLAPAPGPAKPTHRSRSKPTTRHTSATVPASIAPAAH